MKTNKFALITATAIGLTTGLVLPQLVNTSHATSFSNNFFQSNQPNAADIGFAQDMAIHHAQAVEMAMLAKLHGGETIKSYGGMIGDTQNREIGRFFGWLEAWGQPEVATEPMAWMAHDMHGSKHSHESHNHAHHASHSGHDNQPGQAMADAMGMASYAEMEKLRTLRGDEFDILFLQLMIRHHQGGVLMAAAAVKDGNTQVVKGVAHQIAAEQQKEIMKMTSTLKAKGGVLLAYNP